MQTSFSSTAGSLCVLLDGSKRAGVSKLGECSGSGQGAVGKGETTNLWYSITFWKTKDRSLIAILVNNKNQRKYNSLVRSCLLTIQMEEQKQKRITKDNMKNQGTIVSQKENDSSPATELKGVEYCGLIMISKLLV